VGSPVSTYASNERALKVPHKNSERGVDMPSCFKTHVERSGRELGRMRTLAVCGIELIATRRVTEFVGRGFGLNVGNHTRCGHFG
jgi:hypothetical protein